MSTPTTRLHLRSKKQPQCLNCKATSKQLVRPYGGALEHPELPFCQGSRTVRGRRKTRSGLSERLSEVHIDEDENEVIQNRTPEILRTGSCNPRKADGILAMERGC